MKDMSDCNKNNNQDVNLKEEKLFRAMSGVDEDLLLRSEQIRNSGRVHKFPMRYVTRIAAACLCFVVAGVLYMTMSSTKMADSTGNADTAAPQMAYGSTTDGLRQHHRWPTVSLRIRRSRKRRWMLPGRGIQQEQRTRSSQLRQWRKRRLLCRRVRLRRIVPIWLK